MASWAGTETGMDACARGLACPERGVLTLVGPLTCLACVRVPWAKCGVLAVLGCSLRTSGYVVAGLSPAPRADTSQPIGASRLCRAGRGSARMPRLYLPQHAQAKHGQNATLGPGHAHASKTGQRANQGQHASLRASQATCARIPACLCTCPAGHTRTDQGLPTSWLAWPRGGVG